VIYCFRPPGTVHHITLRNPATLCIPHCLEFHVAHKLESPWHILGVFFESSYRWMPAVEFGAEVVMTWVMCASCVDC
jgi:hypothetical protein